MLFGAATASTAHAAFVYDVAVVGDGVSGTGTISLPTDNGLDATGVDLELNTTMFGNALTFTEDDLVGGPLTWTGADPATDPELAFFGLSLFRTIGELTLVLSDDAGGFGSAICTTVDPMTGCGEGSVAVADVAWTYSGGRVVDVAPVVPEPATTLLMLLGLTATLAARFVRRTPGDA